MDGLTLPALPPRLAKAIERIPALPEAARKLLDALDKDADFSEIVKILHSDPVLCAKVLRIANSPFYGLAHPVGSPLEAAAILGTRTLSGIASGCFVAALGKSLQLPEAFDLHEFMDHAFFCACLCKAMAQKMGLVPNSDEAFCVGLLHDIGVLVLAVDRALFPDADPAPPDTDFSGSYPCDGHAELGAELAVKWRLPASFAKAIAWHHLDECRDPLALLCRIACEMSVSPKTEILWPWAPRPLDTTEILLHAREESAAMLAFLAD